MNCELSPKRFVSSYTNDMHSKFDSNNDENIRLVFVDEHDQGSHINSDRERGHRGHSPQNNIIVSSPKYALKSNTLPLPKLRHFVQKRNTLFALTMLHSTLLPISRCLLKFNHLFLPNVTRPNTKKFAVLNESLDNDINKLKQSHHHRLIERYFPISQFDKNNCKLLSVWTCPTELRSSANELRHILKCCHQHVACKTIN